MAVTQPQPPLFCGLHNGSGLHNRRTNADGLRILLADDHEMIRRGLRHIIEQHEGWRVCGEAATGREAVELAVKVVPQVVILDVVMPELNGLEAARQIKKKIPGAEVLIFSIDDSLELVHQAVEAGARAYLLKSDVAKHIIDAIEALGQHKLYFTSSVSKVMLEAFLRNGNEPAKEKLSSAFDLTSREREVIQLLAEGETNKSVANRLKLSVKTVETHRQTIMDKLCIHSMAGLVRYAVRNRMIAP